MNERVALARGDVAYLYLTFSGLPAGAAAQVQIGGSAWGSVDFTSGSPRILLRGPDAPASSALLVAESGPIRVRFVSSPETRTVSGGYVSLVSASA